MVPDGLSVGRVVSKRFEKCFVFFSFLGENEVVFQKSSLSFSKSHFVAQLC